RGCCPGEQLRRSSYRQRRSCTSDTHRVSSAPAGGRPLWLTDPACKVAGRFLAAATLPTDSCWDPAREKPSTPDRPELLMAMRTFLHRKALVEWKSVEERPCPVSPTTPIGQ